jgi:hypothetical protein
MPNRIQQIITNTKKAVRALKPRGIINHHYKVIYFPIPKVASTTVKRVLHQPGDFQDPSIKIHQIEFPTIKLSEIKNFGDYKKFAIVRDPYDRMVSCYKDKIIRWYEWKKQLYPGFLRYNQIMGVKLFYPDMDFIEFMKSINKVPDFLADEHFRSQHKFIPIKSDTLFLDVLIHIEDMTPLGTIFNDLSLEKLIPSNTTKAVKENNFLTAHSKALIYKRYNKDFELLEYSK